MSIPNELKSVLSIDPEVMGGAICFTGTRIPIAISLDNISAGVPMDDFYDAYPSLTHELVQPVLKWENNQAQNAMNLANFTARK